MSKFKENRKGTKDTKSNLETNGGMVQSQSSKSKIKENRKGTKGTKRN